MSSNNKITSADPQKTSAKSQKTSADPQKTSADPQKTSAKSQKTSAKSQKTSTDSQKNSADSQKTSADSQKKYDIFISFKKSEPSSGLITKDYHIASELNTALTNMGLHVFFSEDTLKNLATDHYSREIHRALEDADVLVFVCCNPEYAHTNWIQNELSLFHQEKIAKGKKMFNLLDGVNTKDLPIELRYNQSFFYRDQHSAGADGIVQLTEFLTNHFFKTKPYELQMEQNLEMGKKSIAKMDRMIELIGEIALIELGVVEKNAELLSLFFGNNMNSNHISNIRIELEQLLNKKNNNH